jgi:cyclic pyranopterin monophosphate synthase
MQRQVIAKKSKCILLVADVSKIKVSKIKDSKAGARKPALTHVGENNLPLMVNVSEKSVSARSASAQAELVFPKSVARQLQAQAMHSTKGAVIDTAIIAGTMAVKNTAQMIPFCHALAVEGCDFTIAWHDKTCLRIICNVRLHGKTGVEMEALCGASVAALTVYDMCKALSHDIEISAVKLLHKRGGKSDVGKS